MLWGNDFIQKIITVFQKLSLVLFSVLILVFTFSKSGLIGFIFVFMLAVFLIYIVKPKLRLWGSYVREKSDQLVKICDTCFNGIVDILLTSSSSFFKKKYVKDFEKFATVKYKADILNLLPSMSLMLLGQIGLVTITTFLVYNDKSTEEIAGSIALLILISSRIIPAINRLSGDITGFIRSFAFISRLLELRFDLKTAQVDKNQFINKKNFKKWEKLIVSKISFTYINSKKHLLRDISFNFVKGNLYALTGISGSGKTTFVNILIGLLRQNQGTIFIDENELYDKDRMAWFKEIGLVPQEPFLLDGSLIENIAFGMESENINAKKIDKIIK